MLYRRIDPGNILMLKRWRKINLGTDQDPRYILSDKSCQGKKKLLRLAKNTLM